jgi:hypothetical protein
MDPYSSIERRNRLEPGRARSKAICQDCQQTSIHCVQRIYTHLIRSNLDCTSFLVRLLGEHRDVDLRRGLIVINSTVHMLLLLWRMSELCPMHMTAHTRTEVSLFFGANRCFPFLQPSIFRNSSNSNTRRLQQRYPWPCMSRAAIRANRRVYLATFVEYRLQVVSLHSV